MRSCIIVEQGGQNVAAAAISSINDVRAFIAEYFGAWQGTDVDRIMEYYADEVSLVFAGTIMDGKEAVETNFVRPTVGAFPRTRHIPKNMISGQAVAMVE